MNRKNLDRKFIRFGSKMLILLQVFLLLFIIWVKADYLDFTKQLNTMWIDTKQIESGNKISRYDLAKLLNTVECKDCINTPKDMISKYDNKFWDAFLKIPWKDFGDIWYRWWLYKWKVYYYCVAYVWDNEYMRWYPLETSPVCGWKFCGDKDTTQAEFYQVIINLSAKYIYNRFLADWKVIKKWMDNISKGSYADKYLNSIDRDYISKNASLNKSGYLDDVKYFSTYMKYCMFNIKACGFQEIWSIKQAVWPIAELNILLNQNIIDLPIAQKIDVGKLVDGQTVLNVLYKLYNIVKCDFNNDYDCDLSDNAGDNCPNAYNPTQTDTDKDWIWDVCDSDIDGDGVWNPIWIVDDNGRINIGMRTTGTDLTLFGNSTWDSNNKIWIYINANNVKWSAPVSINFDAITKGEIKKISRDMWDGTQIEETKVTHTFLNAWIYKITAIAYWNPWQATAKITLLVWENIKNQYWIQIITDKIWWENDNVEVLFDTRNVGNIDKIKWSFGDGAEILKWVWQKFKRILNKKWTYNVIAKWYNWSDLKAIASVNIWAWIWNRWASLNSNSLNPNIWQTIKLQTNIWWFENSDIKTTEVNRGDWTIDTNVNLVYQHSYKVWWTKSISQKITLKDWRTITNFLTIFVVDLNMANTYTYLINPSNLVANTYDKINFSTYIVWYVLPNYPLIINKYKQWETRMFNDIKSLPQKFDYIYNKQWDYSLVSKLYINQCIYMEAQASIWIKWNDMCFDAMLNHTLSQFKCDMDKDNIPDVCDDDIDGDGYKNLIWIIKYENPDCSIWPSSGNNNWNWNNVDIQLLKKHIWSCSLDNAFPIPNPDQMDLNMNGIWDVFENQIWILLGNIDPLYENNNDRDGDGIQDGIDFCPDLAENYNLYKDRDWCPEIWVEFICGYTNIQLPIEDVSCGNGVIDYGETCYNCPKDVWSCSSICWNWIHEPGETCTNCPKDAWTCNLNCGNNVIDPWETCINCPKDVANCVSICWNWIYEPGETCTNCPKDVANCSSSCWNWVQEPGETCTSCPKDAKICPSTCGNNIIDSWEICTNCPTDIQVCFSLCGNGIVETDLLEQCDDGSNNGQPGYCSNFCTNLASCGNGIVNTWENCNNCPQDVKSCFSLCGNGIVESSSFEQCDDGSNNGKAGYCSNVCTNLASCGNWIVDPWENCSNCPQDVKSCFSLCGNGIVESSSFEQCDDGSNNGKAGYCSNVCTISNINPNFCGNWVVDPWENCSNCPQDVKDCLSISSFECFQCPCSFVDIANDLSKKDAVRASLWDKLWNILYRVSESKSLDLNID